MQEMIAYEARKVNRDPKLAILINGIFEYSENDFVGHYAMLERLRTIYRLELITTDLYVAIEKAIESYYN